MPHVYFPLSGVISLVTVMAGGGAAEVATVGSEGMVGLPVFLGADFAPCEALCQVPGEAWRMPAAAFREAVQTAATVAPAGRGSPLVALLQHYTHALIIEIGQTAACNRLHRITERCARWLLQAHDRVEGDQFLLTHGFLAQMLGVRRATVTTVMGGLQQSGLIRYTRGRVTIVERRRLEAAACECYRVVKAEFDRLLGPG
jgi:CRP-like cAMP-binding protein